MLVRGPGVLKKYREEWRPVFSGWSNPGKPVLILWRSDQVIGSWTRRYLPRWLIFEVVES